MQISQLLASLEATMRHHGVGKLDLQIGEARLAMELSAQTHTPSVAPTPIEPGRIRANRAGRFLPLASGAVKSGQVVGLIEIGVLRFPVTVPSDCMISLAQDADTRVEFGDTLFMIETSPRA